MKIDVTLYVATELDFAGSLKSRNGVGVMFYLLSARPDLAFLVEDR